MGLNKRKLMNNEGIAPAIIGGLWLFAILLAGTAVAGYAVYRLTVTPDVTYNIADTGFSLAGIDMGSLWPILLIGVGLVVLWAIMRKPKK